MTVVGIALERGVQQLESLVVLAERPAHVDEMGRDLGILLEPIGALEVNGTPSALKVTSRGDTHVLSDPEAQLSELLGWWLPVGSLHAWLLGLPDPAFTASTQPGPDGTLASLEQRLWRVAFASYQLAPAKTDAGSPLLVPHRIELEHGDLHLRLTIDDWHAAAP